MALIPDGESVLMHSYMHGQNGVFLDDLDVKHVNLVLRTSAGGSTFEIDQMKFEHKGRAWISLEEMQKHIGEEEWGKLSFDGMEKTRYFLELMAFIDCQGELPDPQ